MKKCIYSLLILLGFSLTYLQGTAQSFVCKSNNLCKSNQLKFNQNEFTKNILAYNNLNFTLSKSSSQNHLLSKNYTNCYESNIYSETNLLKKKSYIYSNQNNIMGIFDDKDKLLRLDQLIRLKATGTPKQLAKKFEVSESTIKRAIKKLRDKFDCPISYSIILRSYYYEYPGRLIIKFETLDDVKLDKIKGGFYMKNITMSEFDLTGNYVCSEKQKK